MDILNGIKNFLELVNDNWTLILVICGLALGLYKKIKDYRSKTTEEKIEIAKAQIKEIILKMVTEAEIDYEEWNKAGSIKRAQVIEQLYEDYPILSKVIDQTTLISWIDEAIDEALVTLREIISENELVVEAEATE